MGNALRAARTGLVLLGLAGTVTVPAAPKNAPSQQLNWWIGEFNYLKRVPKEPNAPPNDQPVRLSPEMVRQDLSAMRLGPDEFLFGGDEINGLVMPICQALALAGPDEDLIALSTSTRSKKIFATRSGLTARLFVKAGRLNVILHDARLAFYDRYLGTKAVPDFKFGSRYEQSPVEMSCPGADQVRGDWLAFPVVLEAKAPEIKAMAAAPAAAMAPAAAVPAAAAAPAVPAPAAVPVPAAAAPAAAPAAALAAAPAAAPAPKDQTFFEQQQQRLRYLKRMHDDGLISDAEYNKKRQEIIDAL